MSLRKTLSVVLGLGLWVAPFAAAADNPQAADQNSAATDVQKDQQKAANYNSQAQMDVKKAKHNRKKAAMMEKQGKIDAAVDADKAAAKEDKNAKSEAKKADSAANDAQKDMNKQ